MWLDYSPQGEGLPMSSTLLFRPSLTKVFRACSIIYRWPRYQARFGWRWQYVFFFFFFFIVKNLAWISKKENKKVIEWNGLDLGSRIFFYFSDAEKKLTTKINPDGDDDKWIKFCIMMGRQWLGQKKNKKFIYMKFAKPIKNRILVHVQCQFRFYELGRPFAFIVPEQRITSAVLSNTWIKVHSEKPLQFIDCQCLVDRKWILRGFDHQIRLIS